MHKKTKYINKSMYSIQGLRTIGNSLPRSFSRILKKGGHNYSSIVSNWSELVGIKIAKICYPKTIKSNKELKNGILELSVNHGNQLDVEYKKEEIIGKINLFFGYEFIKKIKIVLIDRKIEIKKKKVLSELKKENLYKGINRIKNSKLKDKLKGLAEAFENKKI